MEESQFKALIESMSGMNREEIQSVELKTNKIGDAYWTIKLYALISEEDKLVQKMILTDQKLRNLFYKESAGIEDVVLSTCNKMSDPILSIELSRGAKHEYSWSIKYRSKIGEEMNMAERISVLHEALKNHFGL